MLEHVASAGSSVLDRVRGDYWHTECESCGWSGEKRTGVNAYWNALREARQHANRNPEHEVLLSETVDSQPTTEATVEPTK